MKLALGTVQFGCHYGVANHGQRVSSNEAALILERSKDLGINVLDTAISYGNSETILGDIGVLDWCIITKLPAVPDNCDDVYGWVKKELLLSLSKLRVSRIYGLMLHRPDQLLSRSGPELFQALQIIKSEGFVEKIGISVYEPSEIENISQIFQLDIIQAPLNVIDRRIQDSGWGEECKKLGIELHTRSSFLQGLLLMPAENRPSKFNRWEAFWKEWDGWLMQTGLTRLQACIGYLNSLNFVDRIVVGVDSVQQLNEIVEASNTPMIDVPEFSALKDKKLIKPVCWNEL